MDAIEEQSKSEPLPTRVGPHRRPTGFPAMEPEESAATSLKGESCAEDRIQLVPPGFTGGLESAKDLSPTTPQHGQSSSDDRGAHQVTTEASGAGGSNLLNSTMEHAQAYDASTFPISCSLKKHAQGFYILSGACCLCGQTFRAVGTVSKSTMLRWNNHSTVQKKSSSMPGRTASLAIRHTETSTKCGWIGLGRRTRLPQSCRLAVSTIRKEPLHCIVITMRRIPGAAEVPHFV